MKKKTFFLMMMAAVILSACSTDENSDSKQTGHSNLVLKIKGEKPAPVNGETKASSANSESTINDFTIFVFKANGDNDITPKEYKSAASTVNLQITTDASEVYVIANTASNTDVQNALKAVTKKSDLQAIVGRGFNSDDSPTQSNSSLWMSGNSNISPSQNANVSVTVILKFIAAKVRISEVTVDPSVNIALSEVLVLNAGGATKLIPADNATSLIPSFSASASTPFYMSGVTMDGSWSNKPNTYGVNTAYKYTLTGDNTITTGKNQHDFYVFENDGANSHFEEKPTIITLKATNNSNSETVYYSVLFKMNTSNDGYDDEIIERGKDYNITMTIKKLGTEDPTIPAPQTTVEVTLTPASWETVTMDKTYQ